MSSFVDSITSRMHNLDLNIVVLKLFLHVLKLGPSIVCVIQQCYEIHAILSIVTIYGVIYKHVFHLKQVYSHTCSHISLEICALVLGKFKTLANY